MVTTTGKLSVFYERMIASAELHHAHLIAVVFHMNRAVIVSVIAII